MLISILTVAAFLYRLYVLLLSVLSIGQSKRTIVSQKQLGLNQKYIFLFPVYKEQKIIIDTLRYYEQFLAQCSQIQLLFITTAKEVGKTTTYDLISAYSQKSIYQKRVKLVSCPILDGTKATQINYGLEYIGSQKSTHHLVLFDCDARVTIVDLVAAEKWINQNSTASVYSFLPKASVEQSNFWVRSATLHHGERMLAFEYSASQLSWMYSYPMGATMIVTPSFWQKIERMPEPIDDIPLSYLLQFKHLKAKNLPFFTEVQAPPDSFNLFRQMIPIFKGVFSYFATAKQFKIQLNFKQKLLGVLVYLFYLLEPLAIVLALLGNWYLILLLFLQIMVDLYWLKHFSYKAFLAHSFGYVMRLMQFIYFALHFLKKGVKLSEFKTERR